jgi:hypothetical protein
MAFYTNTIDNTPNASLAARIGQRVSCFFVRLADNQNRTGTVQRMQELSDAKLAQMGVRREDIVRHVYRDIYYV